MDVVEQNDRARFDAVHGSTDGFRRIPVFPISSVDIPVGETSWQSLDLGVVRTVGRPDEQCRLARREPDGLVGPCEFVCLLLGAETTQILVRPGVVADVVTLTRDSRCDLRELFDTAAENKEGGGGVGVVEYIEEPVSSR